MSKLPDECWRLLELLHVALTEAWELPYLFCQFDPHWQPRATDAKQAEEAHTPVSALRAGAVVSGIALLDDELQKQRGRWEAKLWFSREGRTGRLTATLAVATFPPGQPRTLLLYCEENGTHRPEEYQRLGMTLLERRPLGSVFEGTPTKLRADQEYSLIFEIEA